ncbi:hypothetical protein VVR26_01945 [Corynebacterium camporealensis]|uniref:hypothetical protein n=1 Tax=Corynebacterium camporealensis TaxID=161896 RepID=UPI0034CD5ABF
MSLNVTTTSFEYSQEESLSLNTPVKKSIIAMAMVLPLSLAACGNDDEEAENNQTTSSSAESSSSSATSSSKESSSSKSAEEDENDDEDNDQEPEPQGDEAAAGAGAGGAAGAGAMAQAQNPLGEGAQPQPPVEGGHAASPEDAAAIDGLVNGIYDSTNFRQFVTYIPDNTCQKVLQEQGGELNAADFNQIPEIPMAEVAGPEWNTVGVQSIDDLQVNGDQASAVVNVETGEGIDSSMMRFQRENGKWTFCAA